MITATYNKNQVEREENKPEVVVRERYENPGLRCFKISALQLVENHLGERFSFDSYNDFEIKDHGRGVVWRGEYLEGIKIKIFQWDRALKNVYVKYEGNNPEKDLKEIREVLGEAGLEKKVTKYSTKP